MAIRTLNFQDYEAKFKDWIDRVEAMHTDFHRIFNDEIAWSPLKKPLSESVVALGTMAGVHRKDDQAFDKFSAYGDQSFRLIANDTPADQLMVSHNHFNSDEAMKDINCVLPIDRLNELAAEGVVKASNVHFGFMGFNPNPNGLFASTDALIEQLLANNVDVAVFSPGCWMCHRSVGLVQNRMEQAGITTISISLKPEITMGTKVPRAAFMRYPLGTPFGAAGNSEEQGMILKEILELLPVIDQPGTVVDMPYRWRRGRIQYD